MNAVIQDILVYLCYLIIVVWVAEGPRHINSFYLKENLITTVIHGGLLCGRGEYDEPCDPKEDLPMWTNINVSRILQLRIEKLPPTFNPLLIILDETS